jgi:lysosome membrane protein 2
VCSILSVSLAVVLLVAAVVLGTDSDGINAAVERQIDEQVTLKPGHATYEQLQNPTLPIWKDFYFFNLTNPDEFVEGAKPNLTQVGPYSYREERKKTFLWVSPDDSELTYNQSKLFYWDSATSGARLRENDTICTINIPLLGAIDMVEEYAKEHSGVIGEFAKQLLKEIISETGARLYVCVEAHDLAWNYTDAFVQKLNRSEVLKLSGLAYPRCCVNLQSNGSANDSRPSTIYTGVKDIGRIGQFLQWDGMRRLNIWPGETANDINGTEGLFFRPNIKEGEPLMAFVDDVIRSFDLTQEKKVKHKGLEAWRYLLNSTTFLSPLYYHPNSRWGNWEYDGLIYLGVIQYPKVPVYGSQPHFLGGDPILREMVIGMNPDPKLHTTQIDVEVFTGANIQFRQVLQLNARAVRNADFEELANINGTLYYPVLYINEHAELTESFKNYLEGKGLGMVMGLQEAYWPVFGVLLGLALILILVSMVICGLFIGRLRRREQYERL